MDRTRTLRGVGVGAGYFSPFHYDAWSRIDQVQMVAVCDTDPARAHQAAEAYGIAERYGDVAEMLDATTPDFVDVITRPDSHLAIVNEAAQRSVDVICQKPLAPTDEEACRLVAVAREAGIRLMVHENFRFQPWHREIKSLIRSGRIGDAVHSIAVRSRPGDGWQPDAYQSRQPYFATMPRLLVYETGVHFIDVMRYLVGEIDGVYARLRQLNPQIAGEDTGVLMFEFADGACGLWDASRYHESTAADPRYTFGEFLIEGSGGAIRLADDGRISVKPLGKDEYDHPYEHSHRGFGGDCVYAAQQHFVRSLLTGEPFETDGAGYLTTLHVQEACYRSAATGLPVRDLISGGPRADR